MAPVRVCVRVPSRRPPAVVHIAGVSLCGPVSEGPHGRRPIWPISKPMVRESSLSGTMGV